MKPSQWLVFEMGLTEAPTGIGAIFNSLSFIKLGQWRLLAASKIGHRQTEWNIVCKQSGNEERGRHPRLNATFMRVVK